MILNPLDIEVLRATQATGSKLWTMSLNGKIEYCNPSVENIAKEIFLAMEVLFEQYPQLKMHKIRLYETPNCATTCKGVDSVERANWILARYNEVKAYAVEKGIVEYDDRKV